VTVLCRLMGVSRSGFYDYLRRQDRDPDPEHEEKLEWVKDLAEASDNTYGSRRMAKALRALGYHVGRHQARSLMREAGVWVRYRRRYRAITDSNHRQPVFENRLERDFSVDAPDHVYAGDITYVWTQQGWLYLAVVIDLYSRKVVGWSMGRRLTSTLVCDALQMALWRRRPPKGQLIHHSDRGQHTRAQRRHRCGAERRSHLPDLYLRQCPVYVCRCTDDGAVAFTRTRESLDLLADHSWPSWTNKGRQ
jgi:putative transposase